MSALTISEVFDRRLRGDGAGHTDILEHLPLLAILAYRSTHVTEFGVRTGNSSAAFRMGLSARGGGKLRSYDLNPPDMTDTAVFGAADGVDWIFNLADTSRLADIEETDLLFLDTLHTYAQVAAELRHARRVRRYIAFHDTVLNGEHGENGEAGIMPAIDEFRLHHPEWRLFCHMTNCNGLLVLERAY